MKKSHPLFNTVDIAASRTGMDVVMVEDHNEIPNPNPIQAGDDPYNWGASSGETGENWKLKTKGDLLGNPYRIFKQSLAIRRAAWKQVMTEYAIFRLVAGGQRVEIGNDWVDRPVPGLPIITHTDMELSDAQKEIAIKWLFSSGYVPANWPNPLN